MKLKIWVNGFFFAVLLVQVYTATENDPKANLTALQEKVEKLIETVMVAIQEYYEQAQHDFKCLPDKYTASMMNALKEGIDCVERSHRQFQEGRLDLQQHQKEFHGCFANAKIAVAFILRNIDPAENHCPPDVVEKTFQINVTTSYTKTFNLNIQNGVNVVYNKTIQVTKNEDPCRNYPDVFSFNAKSGRNGLPANPTSGTLNHNSGSESGTSHVVKGEQPATPNHNLGSGSGNSHVPVSEAPTRRKLNPFHDAQTPTPVNGHLRQKQRKDEVAYAYFEEFQSRDNAKSRRERSGEPGIWRKTRNPMLKERQDSDGRL